MDYLDPKKKKMHGIRLYVGYALLAIAIGIGTLLLVYIANGYYIDTDGKVIQNGLVYVDSKPSGAEVYLNGEKQRGTTDSRLVIPAGTYDIGIYKPGYRNWTRSLRLEGGSLRRITYPRLIPETLETNIAISLRENPVDMTQSIDKRWLVSSHTTDPLDLTLVDLDANPVNSTTLEIPEALVDEPDEGTVRFVEWAGDNRFFLVAHEVGKTATYLLVDRENPDETLNLNDEFNDSKRVFEISLQDRNRDKFFVFNTDQKSLFTADLGSVQTPAVATKVEQYQVFGSDWVLYITASKDDSNLVEARFKRGDKDILLKTLQKDDEYLLQLAKLGNAPIMGIASPVEDRAVVYNDPENYLNNNEEATIPVATTVLRVAEPVDMIISSDSSVIMAYGSKNFASHEFEADRSYNFSTPVAVDAKQEVRWVDGQHFVFSSKGVQYLMDFDGSNSYDLITSIVNVGSFFSDDIFDMYTVTKSTKDADGVTVPARLNVTSLLTPEDR